jgi:multiple sugar transport system permease protein
MTDVTEARRATLRRPIRRGDERAGWLLVAPAIIGLVAFVYVPIVISTVAGFLDIPISGRGIAWVGFENFADVLTDPRVYRATWNTIVYSAMTIVPSVVIGFLIAAALESVRRGRALVSVLVFLPLTANLVAMAVVFRWIFASPDGFANQVTGALGFGPIDYLGNPGTAMLVVSAVGAWRSISFAIVLFLAGMTTIPAAIHEAAAMDGIRGGAKIRRITLPMLRPIVVLVVVLTAIQSIQVFDTVQVMTDGGPDGATETLFTLIWRTGFSYFDLGGASALTLLVLVVLILIGMLRRREFTRGAA